MRLKNAPKKIWWLLLVDKWQAGACRQISPIPIPFGALLTRQINKLDDGFLNRSSLLHRTDADFLIRIKDFLKMLRKIFAGLELDHLLLRVYKVLRVEALYLLATLGLVRAAHVRLLLRSAEFVCQNVLSELSLVK